MFKCGWTHCSCGGTIFDNQKKVKVGKRWYHEECANERNMIQDIITKFTECVSSTVDVVVLRRVINDIVYNEENPRPVEYVMYALDYAIAHPQMKLTFAQGLYRICNNQEVIKTWRQNVANKQVGSHKIEIETIERPTTVYKPIEYKRMVSDLFD